jgi:hypothetical protein
MPVGTCSFQLIVVVIVVIIDLDGFFSDPNKRTRAKERTTIFRLA